MHGVWKSVDGKRFETPHETTCIKEEFHCNACTKTFYRRDIKMKHEASCFRWRRENEQMENFNRETRQDARSQHQRTAEN